MHGVPLSFSLLVSSAWTPDVGNILKPKEHRPTASAHPAGSVRSHDVRGADPAKASPPWRIRAQQQQEALLGRLRFNVRLQCLVCISSSSTTRSPKNSARRNLSLGGCECHDQEVDLRQKHGEHPRDWRTRVIGSATAPQFRNAAAPAMSSDNSTWKKRQGG